MARIRTIKPEFWTSEQVMELSPMARLLFIGLWNFCDDRGVHPVAYKTLKAEVFPADDVTVAQVRQWIEEIIRQNLLGGFSDENGREWWFVTGWHHQLINRPSKSRYPSPPRKAPLPEAAGRGDSQAEYDDPCQNEQEIHGGLTEDSLSTHGGLIEDSLTEGKGREGNSKGRDKDIHTPTIVSNSNQEQPEPTAAARLCIELKNLGLSDLNPAHPVLLELLKAGATVDEFVQACLLAKEKGKGFSYILGIVKSQRKEAKDAATQVLHGDLPNKSPPADGKNFKKFSGLDYINGGDGYGNKRAEPEGRIIDVGGGVAEEGQQVQRLIPD